MNDSKFKPTYLTLLSTANASANIEAAVNITEVKIVGRASFPFSPLPMMQQISSFKSIANTASRHAPAGCEGIYIVPLADAD